MAKQQSFADKSKKKAVGTCAVCDGVRQAVKTVKPERHPISGSWTFRTRIVVVCKCNHKEVYES